MRVKNEYKETGRPYFFNVELEQHWKSCYISMYMNAYVDVNPSTKS